MTDHPSQMAREIAQIPEATARLLDQGADTIKATGAALRAVDPRLVVTVARGSSDHAATYLKYAIELECGVPVASVGPSVASVVAGLAILAAWQEDDALADAVACLPEHFARALTHDWDQAGKRLARASQAFVLGRGPGFAVALEMALKFKETSALHAEAYSAAEVLHGPAALVGAGFPVLALAVEDDARGQVIETANRLAAQGGDVFMTGPGGSDAVTPLAIEASAHPLTAPLVALVSFYVFVEALSRRRGLDPDAPPHLRKVTETV